MMSFSSSMGGVLILLLMVSSAIAQSTTSAPTPNCDKNTLCDDQPSGTAVYDPLNCHIYYRCGPDGLSDPFKCLDEQYFNGTTCVEETTPCEPICLNCDITTLCDGLEPNGTKVYDPYDCKKYRRCGPDGASTDPFDCTEGYYFNPSTAECEIEDELSPCESLCVLPPNYCQTQCRDSVEYIPDPNDCGIYYQCGPQLPYTQLTCSSPTPYFSGSGCVASEEDCCETCSPYCFAEDVNQQIINPNNCKGYYFCGVEGVPTETSNCSTGEEFYPTGGKCVIGDSCTDYCSDGSELTTSEVSGTTETTTDSATTTDTSTDTSTDTEITTPSATTISQTTATTEQVTTDSATNIQETTEMTTPPATTNTTTESPTRGHQYKKKHLIL